MVFAMHERAAQAAEATVDTQRRRYPWIWFERGGWWFKIFGEVFGPFASAARARDSLGLARQLDSDWYGEDRDAR